LSQGNLPLVHTWEGMFNEEKTFILYLLPFPFPCRPVNSSVTKIIEKDTEILAFISGDKFLLLVLKIHTHLVHSLTSCNNRIASTQKQQVTKIGNYVSLMEYKRI
jgi:hypothetical protein